MTTPITVAAARKVLTAEGNTPENVETAIESLYNAGLAIPAAQQHAAYDRHGKPLAEGDAVSDFRGQAVKFVRISRGSTESSDVKVITDSNGFRRESYAKVYGITVREAVSIDEMLLTEDDLTVLREQLAEWAANAGA